MEPRVPSAASRRVRRELRDQRRGELRAGVVGILGAAIAAIGVTTPWYSADAHRFAPELFAPGLRTTQSGWMGARGASIVMLVACVACAGLFVMMVVDVRADQLRTESRAAALVMVVTVMTGALAWAALRRPAVSGLKVDPWWGLAFSAAGIVVAGVAVGVVLARAVRNGPRVDAV